MFKFQPEDTNLLRGIITRHPTSYITGLKSKSIDSFNKTKQLNPNQLNRRYDAQLNFRLQSKRVLSGYSKQFSNRGNTFEIAYFYELVSFLQQQQQQHRKGDRAVVVAQLAERLLPIPEDPGLNPVISNFY